MFSVQQIREDEAVQEWLSYYTSENTINGYLSSMRKYSNMTGKMPSELIEEAIEESGEIIPKRKYLKYLDRFYRLLKNGGENQKPMAEKSVNKNMHAIISFYRCHRIEIINPHTTKSPKTKNDEVPKVEQIREALDASNPILRAYILIATSSGLSVSDIVRLKIKDIKNIDENDITTLKLTRKKTGVGFYTFFSPEATKAIRQYISIRNGKGTKKGKAGEKWQIKHRINSDNDYLFIKENIADKYLELDNEEAEEFRKMSEYNFEEAFRYLSKRLSVETEKGQYNTIRTHVCRKYFITTLTDLGMGIGDVHFLAGKELPAGFAPYHKPDGFREDAINQWKDRYIDCLNDLMFGEKISDVTKDKYKKIEAEFHEYKHFTEIKDIKFRMEIETQPIKYDIEKLENNIESQRKSLEKFKHDMKNPDGYISESDKEDNEELLEMMEESLEELYESLRKKEKDIHLIQEKYEAEISKLEEEYKELKK